MRLHPHTSARSLLLLVTLLLAGCSLATMTPEAGKVRVVSTQPQGCTAVGRVEVEVTSKVALVKRNPLRVKDELETLARNEAAKIGASTLWPRDTPQGGRQSFEAYRCVR